ncbi:nicotinamide-nucleotide amidohydrolase family protein [Roseococcus sp. SYP-B2431]|uniref:CinA family protein n=1 Tax=Roseococcus sp. SYP-B2431 TaxID=2496640 RepID=UPI001039E1F3|nr:nicotinamide-nucleotide amidohydrolase family protein [Roseococcus sp. SYP-B2431]TCH96494.1 nicotinamide-nucleotide amidohydrolase family protein [Roseococcus sp. SYP-B2431]
MLDDQTLAEAAALLEAMKARNLTLATAESCTGGLIAAALTAVAGSSAVVLAGFVTYSNAAKTAMVGVPAELIHRVGAVSEEVARAMAEGALARSGASIALSCTGVAGPGGGSAEKPVGLVHLGAAMAGHGAFPARTLHAKRLFPGDRGAIRAATVREAFALARSLLDAI